MSMSTDLCNSTVTCPSTKPLELCETQLLLANTFMYFATVVRGM
jgi:hypothetical protein